MKPECSKLHRCGEFENITFIEVKMKIARKSLILFLAGLLLVSCTGQVPTDAPTADISGLLTAGVGTAVANFYETQTAIAPPATMTASITPLPQPTSSPIALPPTVGVVVASPTFPYVYLSPTPTGTFYTPTPNPASLASGCNNLAFLQDVTIPSGTVMQPGQAFTKEWKVANTGTCTWDWSYRVVFVSGSSMNGQSVHPNQDIPVGKWTTLRVPMEAPGTEGSYTGYWQLSDNTGKTFGSLLGVSIVVNKPTKTPAPATPTNTPTSTPTSTTAP
jgi:hypothetical protein